MSRLSLTLTLALCLLLLESSSQGSDWPRFRGPNGSGISSDKAPMPVVWSESKNLKWKRALPGPGSSCPIVLGDRIFVTSWSGYGLSQDNPGEQTQLRRHLTCVDRETGEIVWSVTVKPFLPEDKYGGMFAEHGYASHTPVSDGEHVYVYFGKTGALAFDMDGNQLWQQSVGTESDPRGWGSASSPILYNNLLIVTATAESEALVALDKTTGKEVWRQEASGLNSVWGTPILVEVDDHRTDLVIAVPDEIWGLDPNTGKLRWYCKSPVPNSFCSSVVTQDGIVYSIESGSGGGGGIAVRAGGTGDVTKSHTVWIGQQTGRIGSPLFYDGRIYSISRGIAHCFDASAGDQIFRGRLKATTPSSSTGTGSVSSAEESQSQRGDGRRRGRHGGQDYSSFVLADGKIYFASRSGDIHVLEAGKDFKHLAVNRVTSESEDFSAAPAISQGELYIRSSKNLYCIAQLEERVNLRVAVKAERENQNKLQNGKQEATASETPLRPGRQGGFGGGRFDPVAIFKRSDTDSDGKLSGDEISGRLKDNLKQIDTDQDEVISLDEFQSGMRAMFRRGGRGRSGRNVRQGRPERPQRPALSFID